MMTTLLNNRYQTIQVLGAGGFSETFLAEDTYMPSRRRCVIKKIKPVTNDPQMYQLVQKRFQREAATLESLGEGSDQIPKLYAYFSENGQFYLVQEWIQGQTLTSMMAAVGSLSETAVREILVSLLPVLDYVHSKGIIHRDIKPDNIILRHSNGKPVLIDFGAVKETMATVVNPQGQITHSIVLGTPGFMSPEQAAGRPTYASDLYSLGMTAIYLLTGLLPQELEIDEKTEEILWQRHALNVSPSLNEVLSKAIQYHPRDRYTTAIKMLEALHSSASIPPRQPSTQATVVLSARSGVASSQPAQASSPQTAPVINHPSSQGSSQKALILGSSLVGSLIGAAVIVGLVRNQPPQSSIVTSPLPQSTSEQPITKSTPTAESPVPASEPVGVTPAPLAAAFPSPPLGSAPIQEPEQQTAAFPSPPLGSAPQPQSEQQTAASPSPPLGSAPQPQSEQQTAAFPSPRTESAPLQDNENRDDSSNAAKNNIPGFPIGTSVGSVREALGNPTKTSRGIWPNTRAVLYDLEPNQITLGYLFDNNSGRIRQTEVAFDQSVEPKVIQATLQGMLGDRRFINISQGLQQVYQRSSNNYSFDTGELKGVIQRNDRDRIYIGVWDADLH